MSDDLISIQWVPISILCLIVVIYQNIIMIKTVKIYSKSLNIYYTSEYKTETDKKRYLSEISGFNSYIGINLFLILIIFILSIVFDNMIFGYTFIYLIFVPQVCKGIFFHRYDRKSSYGPNITKEKNDKFFNMTTKDIILRLTLNKFHILGIITLVIINIISYKYNDLIMQSPSFSLPVIIINSLLIPFIYFVAKMQKDFIK